MNDVATICSGLIRLSIATRNLRATRSTLTGLRSQQLPQHHHHEEPILPASPSPSPLDSSKSFNSLIAPRPSPQQIEVKDDIQHVPSDPPKVLPRSRSPETSIDPPIPNLATPPSTSSPRILPVQPESSRLVDSEPELEGILDSRLASNESGDGQITAEQVVDIVR